MTSLEDLNFHRLFAFQMYKNRHFPLSEMTFTSDFVTKSARCDMYPVTDATGDSTERVANGTYTHEGDGEISRFFTRHFPVVTYRLTPEKTAPGAAFGITLKTPDGSVSLLLKRQEDGVFLLARDGENKKTASPNLPFSDGMTLLVTFHGQNADVYFEDGTIRFVHTFTFSLLSDIFRIRTYENTAASLTVSGSVTLSRTDSVFDCGIAQADIRPVRYEDGRAITEDGKIFLTMSVRFEKECCTGVFSWVPGTAQFEIVGALFFDDGSGVIAPDVASSLLFDRNRNKWYLWICAFGPHYLARASFDGDVRRGIHVLDYRLLDRMEDGDDITAFRGKRDDEDPDFLYDAKNGKWHLVICRTVPGEKGKQDYRYFHYESTEPLDGYRFVGCSAQGSETGGSLVLLEDKIQFVCGSSYDRRAHYRVYTLPEFSSFGTLHCDYDDGGFRGWGTVIPVRDGNRTRYHWLTFDRYLAGASWPWSYGNIFGYLAERD